MTPIYQLENNIYIKREDLIPFSFGGNKARKAKLFFDEIDAGDFDCVVTYGSSSSNHCRVVANMCASRGMPCFIISPKEASVKTFNEILMKTFGAEITTIPVSDVHDTIEEKLNELEKAGRHPYFISGGGHGNIGTRAFVDCYCEIKEYEREHDIFFDYIFFASGTGTTQAGLVCGQILSGDDRKIIGISIARKLPRGREVVLESEREYLGSAADEEKLQEKTIFIDSYTGGGYGKQNDAIRQTINEVMIKYGIPLDETYTGKAFYGMKKYLEENSIEDCKVLFIHTGGTPLFFDYLKEG